MIDSMIILNDEYNIDDLKSGGFIIVKSLGYETAFVLEDNGLEIRDKIYYFSADGFEEYVLCRKPLSEKSVAENVLKHGVGGINIDGCRIGTDEELGREQKEGPLPPKYGFNNNQMGNKFQEGNPQGRFPSHLILDGSEEIEKGFPNRKTTWVSNNHVNNRSNEFLGELSHPGNQGFNDDGSASRFYKAIESEEKLIEYFKKMITIEGGKCRIYNNKEKK